MTTLTEPTPASSASRICRKTQGSPSTGSQDFQSPPSARVRVDSPAASRMSVVASRPRWGVFMVFLEELGRDADGHFLRRFSAELEPNGAMDGFQIGVRKSALH